MFLNTLSLVEVQVQNWCSDDEVVLEQSQNKK